MEVPEAMFDAVGSDTLGGAIQRPREGHRVEGLSKVIRKHEVVVFVGFSREVAETPSA